jgi:hypothetical protein
VTNGGMTPLPDGWQDHPPKQSVIQVDRAYGTLEFRGHIERLDIGDEYEFRPHLSVTYRANASVNRPSASVIDLTICQLAATIPRPGRPADVVHRDVQSISVLLTADGETRPLPELLFRLPESAASAAGHVGLGVSDGKLLWPIGVELK